MKNEKDTNNKIQYMPIGMSIGISVGVALGAAAGNIPLFMCIGLSIGLGLGTVIDVRNGNASWGAAKDKEEQPE